MDNVIIFIISLILLLTVAYFAIQYVIRNKRGLDQEFIQRKWKKINDLKNNGQYAMAVIESDKLLDEVLKKRGVKGETMGERLKNADGFVHDIDSAWSAHKLRNKLVHESNFELKGSQAKRELKNFRKSLKSLGAKV